MTAPDIREQLLDVIPFTECANQGTTPDALLNAYRDHVLTEAADTVQQAQNSRHYAEVSQFGFADYRTRIQSEAVDRAAAEIRAARTIPES